MVNEGPKNAHLPLSLAGRPILHRLYFLFFDSTVLPNWFAGSVPFIPFPNGFRSRFVLLGGLCWHAPTSDIRFRGHRCSQVARATRPRRKGRAWCVRSPADTWKTKDNKVRAQGQASVGWWEVAGEPEHSRSFPVWCLFSLTLAAGPGSRSLNLSSIVGKKKSPC